MRIEILYDDGTLASFDTGTLTAGQPFGRGNVLTELVVDFANIAEDGICVDIHHNDLGGNVVASGEGESDTGYDATPYANRVRGCRVCLAEPGDLPHVISVLVDGKITAWQQAGVLVDGIRFERACRLWYSGAPYASDNYKACCLYEYLEASRPDLRGDPATIAALFGYPIEALVDAMRAEFAQPAESAQPADGTKPVEDAQPAEDAKLAEFAQPAEETQPAEDTKPVEDAQPASDGEEE